MTNTSPPTRSRRASASIPRPSCAALARWTTPTRRGSPRSGWDVSGASHAANSRSGLPARARPRASSVGSDAFFESGMPGPIRGKEGGDDADADEEEEGKEELEEEVRNR